MARKKKKRKKKWYEVDKTEPTALDLWREQKEHERIDNDYFGGY